MKRLVRMIRAGLLVLSLLAGAGAVIGGGTTAQAIASPADSAPSTDAPAAARAPSCPIGRVCVWSANDFQGTRRVFSPVAPGDCLKIADRDSGFSSVFNASPVFIRLWQATYQDADDVTRCEGRQGVVRPLQAVGQFSFGSARGLGGY
jgi:hypothetical protein